MIFFLQFLIYSETSDAKDEPYRLLRYKWGIPEGPIDLPPGTCLPLESNLTIMHGGMLCVVVRPAVYGCSS